MINFFWPKYLGQLIWCITFYVWWFTATDLEVNEDEELPRPEEERITQAEKNKRMQAQLKVSQMITRRTPK